AERSDCPAGGVRRDKVLHGSPQGSTAILRQIAERFECGLADSAWRDIKHSQVGDVVFGMHSEANVSQHVLYFGAFVKTEAADQLVPDTAAAEDFFKGPRLKIGAVLDGTSLRRVVIEKFAKLFGDEFSFRLSIAGLKVADIGA